MTTDYLVASLPALAFDAPPPMSLETFMELAGGKIERRLEAWQDIEAQLKNALASSRGKDKWQRPVKGCSLFWKNRIAVAFQEKDVFKREELLDRVWWDAAGELEDVLSPLGEGALAAYCVRLRIAHKRASISSKLGASQFDALTQNTNSTTSTTGDVK